MGWFDDDEESGADEADVVRADPRATGGVVDAVAGWNVATDWVREEAAAVETEVVRIGDDLAAQAGDVATEFAHNAETQFTNDPVEFVARATGAPHVDYDADSSDGTLGLHVDSVYGKINADWKDGQGSQVHSKLGADWGRAPYLATDMVTDDNGEITKLTGTGKLTVPLEGFDVKAEASGGYEKTADGYNATFSESAGVAPEHGPEVMVGLHGGVQDHGEHGYTVTAGPHGSIGKGKGPIEGFDLAEGGLKSSTDLTYGERDGQTTMGVSQTTGAEFKVMGQTVAQAQNTVGVEHTEGPQGERTSVYDTASGTIGNQNYGGTESASKQVKYTYGTDAQGNEVSQVSTTTQVTETDSKGNQTQIVNETDTYDAPVPDIEQPAVTLPDASAPVTLPEASELPNDMALQNDLSTPGIVGPVFDFDAGYVPASPDPQIDQPMVLTSPDIDVDQPMILTSPDLDLDPPMILTSPDIDPFEALADAAAPVTDPAPQQPAIVLPEDWGGGENPGEGLPVLELPSNEEPWIVPIEPAVIIDDLSIPPIPITDDVPQTLLLDAVVEDLYAPEPSSQSGSLEGESIVEYTTDDSEGFA